MPTSNMAGSKALDDPQPSVVLLLPVEVLVGHRELLQQLLVCVKLILAGKVCRFHTDLRSWWVRSRGPVGNMLAPALYDHPR